MNSKRDARSTGRHSESDTRLGIWKMPKPGSAVAKILESIEKLEQKYPGRRALNGALLPSCPPQNFGIAERIEHAWSAIITQQQCNKHKRQIIESPVQLRLPIVFKRILKGLRSQINEIGDQTGRRFELDRVSETCDFLWRHPEDLKATNDFREACGVVFQGPSNSSGESKMTLPSADECTLAERKNIPPQTQKRKSKRKNGSTTPAKKKASTVIIKIPAKECYAELDSTIRELSIYHRGALNKAPGRHPVLGTARLTENECAILTTAYNEALATARVHDSSALTSDSEEVSHYIVIERNQMAQEEYSRSFRELTKKNQDNLRQIRNRLKKRVLFEIDKTWLLSKVTQDGKCITPVRVRIVQSQKKA